MERNVSLDEISDGNLYHINDLVKVGCNDCKGCSACCQGMGNSIVLDPLDIYGLMINLSLTLEELLVDKIELKMMDGIIMANLKMDDVSEKCVFLNAEGRCSIHLYRPGICRLFPLGRYYEDHSFKYFLQVHECKKENKTKVKIRKWIDTLDLKNNERFVINWHFFLKDIQNIIKEQQDERLIKDINMYLLNNFYRMPYDLNTDFYMQFDKRLQEAKDYVFMLQDKTTR
ncbi:MAG TPA: YkgJ family cysteine cluster protein [Lachnospiraceae bacterium]|nr:YkgJ family cysteine cluster protein [Lachnospiraceae bacterium]